MTQTFTTNEQNDIYIGNNGNLAISSGIDAVLQACQTASKALLGEMVLSVNNGIPYFESIWVGSPNYNLYVSYLRSTLLAVDGVLDIQSIELRKSTANTLNYNATIITEFGSAEITNG